MTDATPTTKLPKIMNLRRDGTCAVCRTALAAGSRAAWDPGARVVTCLPCRDARTDGGRARSADPVEPSLTSPCDPQRSTAPPRTAGADLGEQPGRVVPAATAPPLRLDADRAGESAQREYERRRNKRESGVRARHPRLGGLILALSDEPQLTVAWARGAVGERRVAETLDSLRSDEVIVLHDRRIPRSKANIDHLVVASSGIHIVDAKRYKGRIEIRGSGSLFRPGPNKLFIGGRDKTSLVDAMGKQVAAVESVIADLLDPPLDPEVRLINPALCFVEAEVGWFAKPMVLDGVAITWRTELAKVIAQPGPLSPEHVLALGTRLAERLVPA